MKLNLFIVFCKNTSYVYCLLFWVMFFLWPVQTCKPICMQDELCSDGSSSVGCDAFPAVSVLIDKCYLKPRWFLNEDESGKSALWYQTRAQCNGSPPLPLPSALARAAGEHPFCRVISSSVLPSPVLSAAFHALSFSCTQTLSRAAALQPELLPAQEMALSCQSLFYSIHLLTSHLAVLQFFFLFTQPTINTARHRSWGM